MSTAGTVAEGSPDRSTIRRIAIAALAGSSIEWYDFFIYATAAALVFGELFFPGATPLVGTLLAFSTFWAGFLGRPIGGVIFGHLGDRVGRKPILVTALLIMGAATVLIGLLPTASTIGAAAPIILVTLRFVQGLAIGGQWGGAVLLITEYASNDRRGFYGSFAQMGVPVGVILGNIAFLILSGAMPSEQFLAWGWRIPFLASALLIAVALYIQLKIEDTPVFRQLQERAATNADEGGSSPIVEVLRDHWRQVLLAAGAFFVVNGAFYILITGMLDYGTRELGLEQNTMLSAVLISSFTGIVAIGGFALLSDKVGRRPVYLAGGVLLAIWGFPLFWMVNTGSFILITLALIIAQTFLSMMYGPQAALYAEMFSAKLRYSGASLGYQLTSVLAGGPAPAIMTGLLALTGTSLSISFYILAMALITIVSVYLITETAQENFSEEATMGTTDTNVSAAGARDT